MVQFMYKDTTNGYGYFTAPTGTKIVCYKIPKWDSSEAYYI